MAASSSCYPHISSSNSCPYTPFLSSSQPPPDCHIEVQTQSNLYYILVSLPGFTTQDITLATKRRRILHLVADKWGDGGGVSFFIFLCSSYDLSLGHFERKVVFGYDADLTRVRAEFDGSLLTITIPRRITSDVLH
jgi:HSP20 family molecular chaperone IbpA